MRLHEITKYAKVTDFTGIGWITFPSIRKSKGSRQKSSLVLDVITLSNILDVQIEMSRKEYTYLEVLREICVREIYLGVTG